MNFRLMPELEWRWGYPVAWGVMLLIALTTVALFRRRGYF
jgi:magnesium transporter